MIGNLRTHGKKRTSKTSELSPAQYVNLSAYRPAWWFESEYGLAQSQLSTAVKLGEVISTLASPDSHSPTGKRVKVLYNLADATKRFKLKTRDPEKKR